MSNNNSSIATNVSLGFRNISSVVTEDNDDEQERSLRRSEAGLRNISINSVISRSTVVINELIGQNLQQHFNTCLQMFIQNKINTKNVWRIHIFEYMSTLSEQDIDLREMLQVAGTSFDIGAKVYSLRVDDIHDGVIKLARNLSSLRHTKDVEHGTEVECDNSDNRSILEIENRAGPSRKRRRLSALPFTSRRITVVENEELINAEIPKKTTENFNNIDSGKYYNLSSSLKPKSCSLMLNPLSQNYVWGDIFSKENNNDTLKIPRLKFFDQPLPSHVICPSFHGFCSDKENEEENIAQQDSPIPNQGTDNNDLPYPYIENDVEVANDNEQIEEDEPIEQQDSRYEYITDMSNVDENRSLGYSFKPVPSEISPFQRMWAGPAHWKLKHIHHPVTSTPKHNKSLAKRQKLCDPIDFGNLNCNIKQDIEIGNNFLCRQSYMIDERMLPEKLNIDLGDIIRLFNMDAVLPTYNLSENCGNENINQHRTSDDNNNSVDLEMDILCASEVSSPPNSDSPVNDCSFLPGVTKNELVQYVSMAKKINMKKLKNALWEEITDMKKENKSAADLTLSMIYKELPKKLLKTEVENLSLQLAFVALLHMASEHNLILEDIDNRSDVKIIIPEDNQPNFDFIVPSVSTSS